MSRDPRLFLDDILESCTRIIQYTQGMSQEKFLSDIRTYDATLRNLEIIGEAVRNLPDDTRLLQPHIPWTKIAAMRNIIAHVYFGIDNDIIWDILQNKIPELQRGVRNILDDLA